MITPITTLDDPRIAPYRDVKDRDLHRRDDLFIVEGKITVSRFIEQSRFDIVSLFLADSRLEPMAPALARLDDAIPTYTAPQDIMDAIAGFPLHRGVLALARRNASPTLEQLLTPLQPQTLLVLVGLSNHDNVGACFRNAAALGANAVVLNETSCDPLYRKSIRVSAGTVLSLPFTQTGTGGDIIAALKSANYECWSLTPSNGARIHTLAPPDRLALILGPEGPGLPAALMDQTTRITIPMTFGVDSLNVATAGAIALSHVFAARQPTATQPRRP